MTPNLRFQDVCAPVYLEIRIRNAKNATLLNYLQSLGYVAKSPTTNVLVANLFSRAAQPRFCSLPSRLVELKTLPF